MRRPDSTLKILTLGRFSIYVDENPVSIQWPDEAVKVFFCTLLSPLDLFFTWDRLCRSMLYVPATRTSRNHLEEICVRPLNRILTRELGSHPLIEGAEGIRINQQGVTVDANEFYSSVVSGLRELSLDNRTAEIEKFNKAISLYTGSYLPGIPGKIIANARADLELLYQSALLECDRSTGADLHGAA